MNLFKHNNYDKKVFIEHIYMEYYQVVHNIIICNIFSHNRYDIEDCISQTFLKAIEDYEKIKNYENIKAYLIKVAINITYSFNKVFNRRILKQINLSEDVSEKISIEEYVENLIDEEKISKNNYYETIIRDLSPLEQQLYLMHFIQKMPYKEMSSLLNMKDTTVRVRITRLKLNIINKIKRFLE